MPFIKRLNKHQLHFEDLVLLGPEGLEELNDKIEGTIETLENNSERINLTTKIDGCLAPETLVATTEGDTAFSKIISDYNKGKVYYGYGVNDSTGEIIPVELKMPRVKNGNKNWCTIEFNNGGYLTATVDHPIKVDDDYVEAGKLEVTTKIEGIDHF
jgi:hypothetical protein